jgi:S1-C subfamily serine protease
MRVTRKAAAVALYTLAALVPSVACVQVNFAPPSPTAQGQVGQVSVPQPTPSPATAPAPQTPQADPVIQPSATAPPQPTQTTVAATAPPAPGPAQIDASDVVARAAPAVVQVFARNSRGSGASVAQGILTNQHVVKDGGPFEVVAADGRRMPATLVRERPAADIALLRTDTPLPTLELDSEVQRVGATVLVLGFPGPGALGRQMTLTRGVVSATREEAEVTWLQTDAAMNPGNSGGPVINMDGKLVGLATWGVRDSPGLNFAVAGPSIRQFLSGAETSPAASAKPTVAPPKPASTVRPTTPPSAAQPDQRRAQIERRVAEYFQALTAGDYARAHAVCCTPAWRSRYPLEQWQANFRGVTELRYATPFRYVTVEPSRVVVDVDYSFVSRGERRYWTLRWTFVQAGADWLAEEAQASPQTR